MGNVARWSKFARAASFGGQFGSFFRHGVTRGGLTHVFEIVSDVFVMDDELWVSEAVGRELIGSGWPSQQWAPVTVNVVVDLPWRKWFINGCIPNIPRNLDEGAYLKRRREYRHERVDIPALALRPSKRLDVRVVSRVEWGVRLMCSVSPGGLDSAVARFVFADGRESPSIMPPSVVVSEEARILLAGYLDDPGSLLWVELESDVV
jgi:hypothetical protein